MRADDQPAVRAAAADDRLRPHAGRAREGAYLWDDDGNRYPRPARRLRDVQRRPQQPARPRRARRGARARPARLGAARRRRRCRRCSPRSCCAARRPRLERVLFTSTGTEAVEAALKLGRAATGRSRVVSAEHGFHGLTLGSLSANGEPRVHRALRPAAARLRARAVRRPRARSRRACAARTSRVFLVEPVQGKGVNLPAARLPRGRAGALPPLRDALLRRRGADRLRPHRPPVRVRALGPRARPRHRSPSRSRAATCRSARC